MNNKLKKVYLVGGAVRDSLLGHQSKDKDYVVVGETPATLIALGYQPVGSDFPVFLHPKTKEEYALARTERKNGKGYTGFTVDASTSVTLEEDLARRDLTINSMAMDDQGNIIDPFNGQADLKNKILRHTTAAFAEDPVRVLRIARFLARFGEQWSIHPDTQALMNKLKESGELANLVPERVWNEAEKALNEKHPQLFLQALNGLGLFPEIEAMQGIPQPKNHHPEGDVYIHTMLVLKRAADLGFDVETRFAALTHDFGKAYCYQKYGNLHGHEQVGIKIINEFCERLKVPNKFKALAALTSDNHTRCHKLFELTPKKVHRLIVEKMNALEHPHRFLQFLQACLCDAQGRGETFVNKDYPQLQLAQSLLNALKQLDRKAIVQQAISRGKSGPLIGATMREAEIDCLRDCLTELKNKELHHENN
ncbi:multifunctional CCA addition/repair protein [Pseudoalteromonas sp. KG3]|uniref:Multifunctional CCA addition/repair protein n=1 Tax=Pseudoalteromonas prydzensis TaxID=182141 RepID=A0ABR9FIQ4_9GAMM|nr:MULTISPECIES: multifunctional CCA addition/repair protein [Pseudoalteromonas]MBE0456716.1 multifunctional CCA addition/repair protein [Pseudoalteromonas prydzensis]WKD22833.1 multifunctional CCA addition/repair protein [Pseudoalteromonas sp. KG3]